MLRKLIFAASLLVLFVVPAVTWAQSGSAQSGDAQIRFAHFVDGAPNVDVFMNGVRTLQDYEPTWQSTFVDIESGSMDVAITTAGEGIKNALVTADNLRIEAGHKYSLSLMGRTDHYSTLLIDETKATAGCDMSKSNFRIIVNNIAGSPPISFYEGDQWREKNIASGSYSMECFPAFASDTGWAVARENLKDVLFTFDDDEDGYMSLWEPYTVYFEGMMGSYPGTEREDYYFSENTIYTLAPDPIAFLSAFSGLGMTYDSKVDLEFDQVVDDIRAAGLEDMLKEDGSYTMFVPTDQALAALPKSVQTQLDDPDTLKDVLLYHIVEGDPNYTDLTEAGQVTTLQGSDLTVTTDKDDTDHYYFYLNGDARVENYRYRIVNGWRLYFISSESVLMPADHSTS
jgi:hypothetical protein